MNQPMERQPDDRKDQRYSLNIRGFFYHNGVGEPVIIRNISSFGALLEGRYFPIVGAQVEIIAPCLEVTGTVIWHGPDTCGVLLSHEVQPETIVHTWTTMVDLFERPSPV